MDKRKRIKLGMIAVLAVCSSAMIGVTALGGCTNKNDKPNGNDPGGVTSTTLADVVKNGKKGTEYTVEGVVYGVTSNGYFIADAENEGRIFVKDETSVTVGDKLTVKGSLTLDKNATGLENATVTKTASGQTALQPAESTLKEINGIAAGRIQHYQYFNVNGTLTQDNGVYKLTEGTDYILFDSRSNAQYLTEWVGKKIDISVITCGYSSSWEAVFVGGAQDIKEHATDLDAVKEAIFGTVGEALAKEVYFSLDLPKSYPAEPGVKFAWSVTEGGSAIEINDNVATINEVAQAVTAKLQLELSCGGKTATKTYTVTVKTAPEVALKDVGNSELGALVKTQGKIITKGVSQVEDRLTVLITDDEGNILAVDLDRASHNAYTLGDTIKAVGMYTTEGVARMGSIESALVSSDPDYSVDYSTLDAIELATDADYEAAVRDVDGSNNKLFKITAPYFVYSGNTTYNFIRFGANPNNTSNGYSVKVTDGEGAETTVSKLFCFARNAMEYNVGDFEDKLNVPLLGAGAKKYGAYTIYAYAMFMGTDTWQFIIPEEGAIVTEVEAIADQQIKQAFGETFIDAKQAGTLTLPTKTEDFEITSWTSSEAGVIDCATGAYNAVTDIVSTTLTAHFTYGGKNYTVDIEVTFMGKAPEYLSVSEAMAQPDGAVKFMKGVVIGFAPNTGTGIPGGAQMGVYISDGKQIMYIPEGQFDRSDDAANYDKVYLLADGHRIAVGDELCFMGAVKEGNYISLGEKTVLGQTGLNVSWAPECEVVTISSFADMKVFFSDTNNVGKVIKFVGTAESPLFLGGSSSTYDSLNLKFYYEDIEGGVSSDNVKIGGRTIAAKARSSEHALGLTWWKTLNPEMSEAWVGTDTKYGFTGEIYAVWSATSTSYCQMALLSGGFNLNALTDEVLAKREIKALIPESANAGEAGKLTLPAETAHAKEIVWSSSSSLIDCTTGDYQAVLVDTKVTLTATYKVGQESKTCEIEVTLIAAVLEEYSVTGLLTATELPDAYALIATVASIGSTSSNTAEQRAGIILTDGVNTIWYNEKVYDFDGKTIKRGDSVKIIGGTLNKAGGNQIFTGGTLEVLSEDNALNYDNIKLYATVSNDTELANLAQGMATPLGGVVVKFTGTFSFVGTGSSNCRYQLNYKDAAESAAARYAFGDYTDSSHGNRTFSFSVAGNNYTFDKWYEACGMPVGQSKTCYPVTGTIYAVSCGYGATMYAWSIIAIDCQPVVAEA